MSDKGIKVHRKEHHQVISTFKYYFLKKDVIKNFSALEQFKNEMKQSTSKYLDFESKFDHSDREDDWCTESKVALEVEY
jgi:hypothetical protein